MFCISMSCLLESLPGAGPVLMWLLSTRVVTPRVWRERSLALPCLALKQQSQALALHREALEVPGAHQKAPGEPWAAQNGTRRLLGCIEGQPQAPGHFTSFCSPQ